MKLITKVLIIEAAYFIGFPLLGAFLFFLMGPGGLFLHGLLFVLWCWELYAFGHYRYLRQEEFLHVLQTAAKTQAPIESVLATYLEGRPREHFYRSILLFFVFPGYYWIHVTRSFDARLAQLALHLERGVPLNRALAHVPGVVTNQTLLAITVGQFTGRLAEALNKLPGAGLPPQWLELGSRLIYPMVVLLGLLNNVAFMMLFIIPKFEKIFQEFKLRLPFATELLISVSRWSGRYAVLLPMLWVGLLVLFNLFIFSSRVKWYFPGIGRLYRMHARGQFLQTLGLMLETNRPITEVLYCVLDARLLPTVIAARAERLAVDLGHGEPFAESLTRHGLATQAMAGLIASAERANHLAWALQEIGDSSIRRGSRLSYRLAMVGFLLALVFCSALVAYVAVSMFAPLVAILEGLQ